MTYKDEFAPYAYVDIRVVEDSDIMPDEYKVIEETYEFNEIYDLNYYNFKKNY